MTKEDLIEAKIANQDGKIGKRDLGLLILKYGEQYSNNDNFLKLEKVILDKFDTDDINTEEQDNEFFRNCLAISNEDFQRLFFAKKDESQHKTDVDRLLDLHNKVVSKCASERDPLKKENIRQARSLAEESDNLSAIIRKYIAKKEVFDQMVGCLTDELLFDEFYSKTAISDQSVKNQIRDLMRQRFPDTKKEFEIEANRCFSQFVKYQIKSDVRLIDINQIHISL